jgi:hypothetical protein
MSTGSKPGHVRWLLLLCLLLAWRPGEAQDDPMSSARVSSALDRVLDDSFQKELPTAPPEIDRRVPSVFILPSQVLRALWIVLAALLVFYLMRELVLPRFFPEAEAEEGAGTEDEDALLQDLPLPDHSGLAAQGQFAEAIRVLLLQAIVLLSLRLKVPLPESLTSREVLSRLRLRGTPHEDLFRLVHCVETGHFGGVEPEADDYRACLAGFERLRAENTVGA